MSDSGDVARRVRLLAVALTFGGIAAAATIACTGDDDSGSPGSTQDGGDDGGLLVTNPDATTTMRNDSGGATGEDGAALGDDATPGDDDGSLVDSGDSGAGNLDGSPATDSGVDAAPNGVWAFTDYCGAQFGTTCPAVSNCPASEAGDAGDAAVEATPCNTAAGTCVALDPSGGTLRRLFTCLPSGGPAWAVNALCASSAENCSTGVPDACAPDDAAVFGTSCTAGTKCNTGGTAITAENYACIPGDASVWIFDGYCGATPAGSCSDTACTVNGPVAGASCTTPRARCVNNNDKIFVCAQR